MGTSIRMNVCCIDLGCSRPERRWSLLDPSHFKVQQAWDNRASKERQNCSRVSRSKTKHRRASSGQCEVYQPWRAADMAVQRSLCHLGMNAFTSVFGGAAACAIFNVGIPRDDRWNACLAMLANPSDAPDSFFTS
jgi:hypothetical protein